MQLFPVEGFTKARSVRVGGLHPAEVNPRLYWEAWGFIIREPSVEQAQIGGVPVEMPLKWTINQKGDEPLAILIDDQQRSRAILSTPLRWQPSCCIIPLPRFVIILHFAPTIDAAEPQEGEVRASYWCYKVIDHFYNEMRPDKTQGRLLFASEPFEANNPDEVRSGHASARNACRQWLNEHWPEWENPFAYWTTENRYSVVVDNQGLMW